MILALEHDPGKGKPVLRKHHARIKYLPTRSPQRVRRAGMRPVRPVKWEENYRIAIATRA
jgi:hypothetical protein